MAILMTTCQLALMLPSMSSSTFYVRTLGTLAAPALPNWAPYVPLGFPTIPFESPFMLRVDGIDFGELSLEMMSLIMFVVCLALWAT